jgi:SAM-dependent methyltransferase
MKQPEFDSYSSSYETLLKDPIRDRFMGADEDFFHTRKRDLIREHFRSQGIQTSGLRYLDVGCGKGELLGLLRDDFSYVAGCDPSREMLKVVSGADIRTQEEPDTIPFGDEELDFVSAVCVYHHVPPEKRLPLTREIRRVLRRHGVFVMIEHNPYNPITRLVVSRTPVDANAVLLRASEARGWMEQAGFKPNAPNYFLYLPAPIYRLASALEHPLRFLPLGGQYAIFGSKA